VASWHYPALIGAFAACGLATQPFPVDATPTPPRRTVVLLIIGIILLIIAIAGGAIVHPLLFALAIVAIVLFFMSR